jgi:hypothetical protein
VERKTAVNLHKQIIEVMKNLKETWDVSVIAVTTDASGESRKARRMLNMDFPELATPDCYAHQVSRSYPHRMHY